MKPLKQRAFELDALRGLAMVIVLLHHTYYDLRYIFNLDILAFQESWWYIELERPVFLSVFLIVSGICCTFSRNNFKRGLRLLAVALLLTAVTITVSAVTDANFYILFNVLHLLALGMLIYAGITAAERKQNRQMAWVDVVLLLLATALIWLVSLLPFWAGQGSYWLMPFGIQSPNLVAMADYLPIIPWLGIFFIGTVIGRRAYVSKSSAFPSAPGWLKTGSRPLCFIGRHSLLIYILHQPLVLAVLYGLRAAGLI